MRKIKRYKILAMKQMNYRDEMYNMRNIVSNIVTILYGDRW